MFTMGTVHTRDYDPGSSVADPEPAVRQTGGGSYCMPIQEYNSGQGVNTPSEHLEALK